MKRRRLKNIIILIVLAILSFIVIGILFRPEYILDSNYDIEQVKYIKYVLPYKKDNKYTVCKNIKNKKEIKEILEGLQSAKLGEVIEYNDLLEDKGSRIFFYDRYGFTIDMNPMISFADKEGNIIHIGNKYKKVRYDNSLRTPYKIFQESKAEIIKVNEKDLFE